MIFRVLNPINLQLCGWKYSELRGLKGINLFYTYEDHIYLQGYNDKVELYLISHLISNSADTFGFMCPGFEMPMFEISASTPNNGGEC